MAFANLDQLRHLGHRRSTARVNACTLWSFKHTQLVPHCWYPADTAHCAIRLQFAGTFRATFLVVTAADYLANDLSCGQRQRWLPEHAKSTLDIGCAWQTLLEC